MHILALDCAQHSSHLGTLFMQATHGSMTHHITDRATPAAAPPAWYGPSLPKTPECSGGLAVEAQLSKPLHTHQELPEPRRGWRTPGGALAVEGRGGAQRS
jgi:hypothetical protein